MMNKAFSLLETVVSVTLIAILTSLTFPLIKNTTMINKIFHTSDKEYKKINRIITSMEKTINNSKNINLIYPGKEMLKKAYFIANFQENIKTSIPNNLFLSQSNSGNLVFLEYPCWDEKNIIYGYIIFFFYDKNLYFIEGTLTKDNTFISKKQAILKDVEGYFEDTSYGIIINIKTKNNLLKGFGCIENKI